MDIKDTTDMSGVWDKSSEINTLGTIQLTIPRIGTFVWFEGESYEIISSVTYQEESSEIGRFLPIPTFTTMCRLQAIDDEGEPIGTKELITVRSSDLRLI